MEQDQTVIRALDDASGSKSTPSKSFSKTDKTKIFKYDKSYWSFDSISECYAGQEQVFIDLGMPLLDNAFKGFNNCIFAYGQTGSGKSYSMMGPRDEPGVIPRICQQLFTRIAELSKDDMHRCTVEVSYLEIYNERVRDLLNPRNKGNLRVREHPSLGPYVEDLSRLAVGSFAEIEELMDEGNKARTVAATNMNETSSRSHAVFTLTVTQHMHDVVTNMDAEKVSRISLVDLAGSERASATGATGSRLKEGSEINRSLSALGRVIRILADLSNGKKQTDTVVPYRDSALTWLLKDSLGGNSMTAMIATISPADINYEETLSTLRYADSAKRIKNHAIVNEDPNAKLIRELKEELALLRTKLETGDGKVGEEVVTSDNQLVSIVTPDGTVRLVSRAEIAEQLNASEKLLKEVNQTWEERLATTQEIHKEREAALEELGINIEKGFVGLHTPKNIPYLVNLSDDPLLAECLVYNIKRGATRVGNADSSTTAQIRLRGSKILQDHCAFENEDGVVTIIPNDNAAVMVNGLRLSAARRLHSGDRVILGDFHIFRFNHPQEALRQRHKGTRNIRVPSSIHGEGKMVVSPTDGPKSSSASDDTERASLSSDYVDFPSFEEVSSRAVTPNPAALAVDDSMGDWSFARMEAAKTYLGPDSTANMASLTDEELDRLFDEMQRVRSIRKGRPDSSLDQYDGDTDSIASVSSSPYASRDRRSVSGIYDFFSEDPFSSTASRRSSNTDVYRPDSLKMKLNQARSEFRGRMDVQRELESKLRENMNISPSPSQRSERELVDDIRRHLSVSSAPLSTLKRKPELSQDEKIIANKVIAMWRRRGSLRMIDAIYRHAFLLKEAQIMSNEMNQDVRFQFTIVDEGFVSASSYDLVLNNAEPEEDEALLNAVKPCIAARAMDFRNEVIKLYSIAKLESRVKAMRNIYNESPMYAELHGLSTAVPFSDTFFQKYTYIGDAYVPMVGVLRGDKTEFSSDIVSPHTLSVIGIVNLSLEPSEETDNDRLSSITLVANLRSILGFSEREFTEVHVQMFLPGGNETYPGGMSTSQIVSGFGDSAVVFDSYHAISLGSGLSAPSLRNRTESALLQLKFFAKISSIHLEKLQSWDDMREDGANLEKTPSGLDKSDLAIQQHDAFVNIQVLELSDSGLYEGVDILRGYNDDKGLLYLHIGVQKRIRLSITHSSGDSFDWSDISKLAVGDIRLVDAQGNIHDSQSKVDRVELRTINKPKTIANADGTRTVTVVGQWDSSAHSSIFLDRTTADRCRIVMGVSWQISTPSITFPVEFTTNLVGTMQGRAARGPSRLSLILASSRITHSYIALFQVQLRRYNAADPRPLSMRSTYISGEENLGSWKPRGVSLVGQYIVARNSRIKHAELDHTNTVLSYVNVKDFKPSESETFDDRQVRLLETVLDLWKLNFKFAQDHSAQISPMPNFANPQPGAKYVADVRQIPKSSIIVKSGYVWMPDDAMQTWVRRYIELRRPFLHVYSLPDMDGVFAINVTQCRIGYRPEVIESLQRPNIFAIYTDNTTHLIGVKAHSELSEWVMKIGQGFGNNHTALQD
ncbi:hypothetical protein V1517DRAFT_322994 [Lipomyces orientalis]|uniref:Uncharacterized protein n=1 Tax=Lipomyces orientalis TaxID=1233043 RepID=A0ACC3TPC0_9ASCO